MPYSMGHYESRRGSDYSPARAEKEYILRGGGDIKNLPTEADLKRDRNRLILALILAVAVVALIFISAM